MKYVIELAQKIATNTFNFMFLKTYDDLDECAKAISELRTAFSKCGIDTSITIYNDHHIRRYYIEY